MKIAVEINNLTLEQDGYKILDDVSLTFYEGVNAFICGNSSAGKTTLLSTIKNNKKYNEIECFCNVGVIEKIDLFLANSVEDELKYLSLDKKMQDLINCYFDATDLSMNPNNLKEEFKYILMIFKKLILQPKILFLDNILDFLSLKMQNKLLELLRKEKITLVVVSNNIENALNYDYMVVMNNGMVAIEGKTMQVLREERILKRLGIGLPFYVDLSLQLKSYGLIDDIFLSKEELVDKLWK